ncbi:MAG: hypothetical protein A2096_02195 [Spirochaetes bacterium GWF1_41_5]|nr:MAG: hypothetical protein A2096_02195 [Spirochaetes bacterium GWF1_41_5]
MKINVFFKTCIFIAGLFVLQIYSMPSYHDVLVVINEQVPESVEIGSYFISNRNIPPENVCVLSLRNIPYYQKASEAEKLFVADTIKTHIINNGLDGRINFIVLSAGFPQYTRTSFCENQIFDYSVNFELNSPGVDIFSFNPYFYYMQDNYNNHQDYKFNQARYGFYIFSRLEGPGTTVIKKMIDNSGAAAYNAYKNGIKFVYNSPSMLKNAQLFELQSRSNVSIEYLPYATASAVNINNIDFMSWDMVGTNYEQVGEIADWWFPPIYRGFTFDAGSIAHIFRSSPMLAYTRLFGGVCSVDQAGNLIEYRKKDGSDIAYRSMGSIAYDPENNWLWCGLGIKAETLEYTDPTGTDPVECRKTEAERGGGVAVINQASGELVGHYTSQNSDLLNNRVTKVAYDAYQRRIWLATYDGIQYFDCAEKNWSGAIAELSCSAAYASEIYIDPYDTDKIYAAYNYRGNIADISTQMPDGIYNVFEYSKSTHQVNKYLMSTIQFVPQITKTANNIIWNIGAKKVTKYDTAARSEIYSFLMDDILPFSDIQLPSDMISQINSSGETYVYIPFADLSSGINNYLLRIKVTGYDTQEITVISNDLWNHSLITSYRIRTIKQNPNNIDELFIGLACNKPLSPVEKEGVLMKSADGRGETWQIVRTNNLENLQDICIDNISDIACARSYEAHQQLCVADWFNFGVSCVGGGVSHDNMIYKEGYAAHWYDLANESKLVSGYSSMPYYTFYYSYDQVPAMSLMLLDGYYLGEARYGVFKQYPATGNNGYEGHETIFDPKCAPYAPRVNEENIILNVGRTNRLTLRLFSPGLPAVMDTFLPETISASTVTLQDEYSNIISPAVIEYNNMDNSISFVAPNDLFNGRYYLTLVCGEYGIKNLKGASLVNTRSNEFKDEITIVYTVYEIGNEPPPPDMPPVVQITAPKNGKSFTDGDQVLITASAVDSEGYIQKVEFHVNGIFIGLVTNQPYEMPYNISGTGQISVKAKAWDNGERSAEDEVIIIAREKYSLRAKLSLDENSGDIAFDSSTNGYSGFLYGTPARIAGKCGKALFFDGIDDYIDLGSKTDWNLAGTSHTICFWFKADMAPISDYARMADKFSGGTPGSGYMIAMRSGVDGGKICIAERSDGANVISMQTAESYADGVWHHLAYVTDAVQKNAFLFIDGIMAVSDTYDGKLLDNTRNLLFGKGPSGNYFSGSLDEIYIFSRKADITEIQSLAQGKIMDLKLSDGIGYDAFDYSYNYNSGSINGDIAWVQGIDGQALSFNGSNSYINMSNKSDWNISGTDHSITLNFKLAAAPTEDYTRIIDRFSGGTPGAGYLIAVRSGEYSGRISIIQRSDGGNVVSLLSPGAYVDNEWHKLLYTVDTLSKTAYLFIDDQLVCQDSYTGNLLNCNGELIIGRNRISAQQYLNGILDNIAFHKCFLEPALTELLDETNLVFLGLDETSGDIAYDATPNEHDGTLTGQPARITGRVEGCYAFDGIDDSINMGNKNAWNMAGYNHTISYWFNVTNNQPADFARFLDRYTGGSSKAGYFISMRNGLQQGKIYICQQSDSSNGIELQTSASYSDNAWHYLVYSVDITNRAAMLYIDGTLAASDSYTGTLLDYNDVLYLGSKNNLNLLSGKMDHFSMRRIIMSEQEVNNEYSGMQQ